MKARTILNHIKESKSKGANLESWRASSFRSISKIESGCLEFSVSGDKHSGLIRVIHNLGVDTYSVQSGKKTKFSEFDVCSELVNILPDDLASGIDALV